MTQREEVSPQWLLDELRKRIVGQEEALRAIATALGFNAWRLKRIEESFDPRCLPRPKHILLAGPSGRGKTLIAETAAELTGRILVSIAATRLTQDGYVGLKLQDLLAQAFDLAGGDLERAQEAIIFIDELDKIPMHASSEGIDVNGSGAQHQLLTALQGTDVLVQKGEQKLTFNTSNLTFIFAGVFERLDDGVDPKSIPVEQLVNCGISSQLADRIPVRVLISPLTREESRRILCDLPTSPLVQLRNALHVEGVDLEVENGAIEAILDLVDESGTARSLEAIVVDRLEHIFFKIPEYRSEGICKVVVDQLAIIERQPPFEIPGDAKSFDVTALKKPSSSQSSAPSDVRKGSDLNDLKKWNPEKLRERLGILLKHIQLEAADFEAKVWWKSCEYWVWQGDSSDHRLRVLVYFVEQLMSRNATLQECFNAWKESGCGNMQGLLHYVDYMRVREKQTRSERAESAEQSERERGWVRSGQKCLRPVRAGYYVFAGFQDGSSSDHDCSIVVTEGEVFPDVDGMPCWWCYLYDELPNAE